MSTGGSICSGTNWGHWDNPLTHSRKSETGCWGWLPSLHLVASSLGSTPSLSLQCGVCRVFLIWFECCSCGPDILWWMGRCHAFAFRNELLSVYASCVGLNNVVCMYNKVQNHPLASEWSHRTLVKQKVRSDTKQKRKRKQQATKQSKTLLSTMMGNLEWKPTWSQRLGMLHLSPTLSCSLCSANISLHAMASSPEHILGPQTTLF